MHAFMVCICNTFVFDRERLKQRPSTIDIRLSANNSPAKRCYYCYARKGDSTFGGSRGRDGGRLAGSAESQMTALGPTQNGTASENGPPLSGQVPLWKKIAVALGFARDDLLEGLGWCCLPSGEYPDG